MNFLIEKEEFFNHLRIVEKATSMKGPQPVLANILIETVQNKIKLTATDLDITIVTEANAQIKEEGKITVPAKKLFEIVSKLPDKPVDFLVNEEKKAVVISCSNLVFEIVFISAAEYPQIEDKSEIEQKEKIEIESKPFVKSIKKTCFAAANSEVKNIISGVFCSVSENALEMAATDGNRLAKNIEEIVNKEKKEISVVIPSKALQEVLRIVSFVETEEIGIYFDKTKIIFKIADVYLFSRLLEGQYPPYKQLIPQTCSKKVIVNREDFVNSLERVSIMVSEKMNIVKFVLEENKMYLKADTPNEGASEDVLDVQYQGEELKIAFNYKYVLDCLKIMDSEKIEIGLNGNLSATLFSPDNEENYLCLIMPIQIK